MSVSSGWAKTLKTGGDSFLVKFEGEPGHVVLSEYLGILLPHAAELLESGLDYIVGS